MYEGGALPPGLISRVLTVSPVRRQAIYLVLAHRHTGRGALRVEAEGVDADLATVLRRERAREIIAHGFGAVPDGIVGALERLGGATMSSARAYVRLWSAFSNPEQRRKAASLGAVGGPITEDMLGVLDALDPRWIHAATLQRLANSADARMFNDAIRFVQSVCSTASDAVVADAIARLQPNSTLTRMVQQFVRRADFPAHPIEADDDIRPLLSVRDHLSAARTYRNCLSTKIEEVLVGRAAYAEFKSEAILEFRPLSDDLGWVLWQVHVARNGEVPRSLADEAEAKCSALGIGHINSDVGAARLRAYRRFVRPRPWADWMG